MYQLIAKDLRERIESGELPPGRLAPNGAQGQIRCAAKHRQGRGQVPRYSRARRHQAGTGERSSPRGSGRSSPPEGHGVAEAGHRDLIQVRPPTEDEARFFALAGDGRAAVLSCPVCTGYRVAGVGRRRPGLPTPFPADRNVFCISSGQVPPAQPAPAEGCAEAKPAPRIRRGNRRMVTRSSVAAAVLPTPSGPGATG